MSENNNYKPSYMSPEEMQVLGIDVSGKAMETGERRARLKAFGLTSNITDRTAEDCKPGWQDAHFHKGMWEVYTCAVGRIALVVMPKGPGMHSVTVCNPGESLHIDALAEHNVYVFEGAKFFCNQFQFDNSEGVGNPDRKGNDWWPAGIHWEMAMPGLGENELVRMDQDRRDGLVSSN